MIYLDNAATTAPDPRVMEKINTAMYEFGNPSSLHRLGQKAEAMLNYARQSAAWLLACDKKEIFFTSGGTLSNNIALFGAAYACRRAGNRIVSTAAEHESVLAPLKALQAQGFEVILIAPGKDGNITAGQFEEAIDENTVLVSAMYSNNETGAVLPVKQIKNIIKNKNSKALFHCDAVQAFGKLPMNFEADLISVSAHKIHGCKGAGALYVKKGARINPLLFGGGQEGGICPGTQGVPLIAGLGEACKIRKDRIDRDLKHISELNAYLRQELQNTGLEHHINSPESACPYVLNFSIPGYNSETVLHFLEEKEIFISSGAACSSGKGSHVLKAMNLPEKLLKSAVRVSFKYDSTKEEVDGLLKALKEAAERLVRAKN